MDEKEVRYYNIEQPPKKTHKGIKIFAIILGVIILLGILFSCVGKEEGNTDINKDHITILHIEGTISGNAADSIYGDGVYDQEWILDCIDDAIESSSNKGMIIYVDSPGGSVYETDEVYFKLLEYKDTGRPLYAYMGSMAASGGYYISAPADKILANRNCWTGSIGVTLGTMYDFSELLDKYGVKTETITSGDNKAMGSSVEPMSEEQKAIFQSLVDESYDQFVGIVAEGRGMSVEQVKKLADGRIYTAKQAADNGLIDGIGTLDDAIADMEETYELSGCETNELVYESEDIFSSLFAKVAGPVNQNQGDLSALLQMMQQQNQVPIVYMAEIQK